MKSEFWHFIVHLRLHYQFLILSGGFLLPLLLIEEVIWSEYIYQFLVVYICLFGGATAYNSYWDKDEGAIGGLRNPPKMTKWMWIASLLLQLVGFILILPFGWTQQGLYVLSFFLFWAYSSPLARWKGDPHLSILAIAVSTGTNSFLMGTIAAGGTVEVTTILLAIGVSMILVSLYPISQVYQIDEDQKRGDHTFAARYGLRGVRYFFLITFGIGVLLSWWMMLNLGKTDIGSLFLLVSLCSFGVLTVFVFRLHGAIKEYRLVMNIKFGASFSFVVFILLTRLVLSMS